MAGLQEARNPLRQASDELLTLAQAPGAGPQFKPLPWAFPLEETDAPIAERRGMFQEGFDAFLYSSGPQNAEMSGAFTEALGIAAQSDAVYNRGHDIQDWAKTLDMGAPGSIPHFEDIDSTGDFFRWVASSVGQGLGSFAIPIFGGAVGAAAGAPLGPGGAFAGGVGGAFVANNFVVGGEAYLQFQQEGIDRYDAAMAAIAIAPYMAALDTLGLAKLLGMPARGVRQTFLNYVVKQTAKGAGIEGATEAAQGIIREATAAKESGDPRWAHRISNILNETAAAGMTGGFARGAAATARGAMGRRAGPAPQDDTLPPEEGEAAPEEGPGPQPQAGLGGPQAAPEPEAEPAPDPQQPGPGAGPGPQAAPEPEPEPEPRQQPGPQPGAGQQEQAGAEWEAQQRRRQQERAERRARAEERARQGREEAKREREAREEQQRQNRERARQRRQRREEQTEQEQRRQQEDRERARRERREQRERAEQEARDWQERARREGREERERREEQARRQQQAKPETGPEQEFEVHRMANGKPFPTDRAAHIAARKVHGPTGEGYRVVEVKDAFGRTVGYGWQSTVDPAEQARAAEADRAEREAAEQRRRQEDEARQRREREEWEAQQRRQREADEARQRAQEAETPPPEPGRDAEPSTTPPEGPSSTPGAPSSAEVAAAAAETAEPTDAQKKAGNYKKGHVNIQGLDISIENPKGSQRTGIGKDGKKWSVTMPSHYGYVRRTEGADGDQVDVYVGEDPESRFVYVFDQVDADTKKFDEHKVMVGYDNILDAIEAYDAAFDDGKGPQRRKASVVMNVDEFKDWLKTGDTKKPIAEQFPEQASDIGPPPPRFRERGRDYHRDHFATLRAAGFSEEQVFRRFSEHDLDYDYIQELRDEAERAEKHVDPQPTGADVRDQAVWLAFEAFPEMPGAPFHGAPRSDMPWRPRRFLPPEDRRKHLRYEPEVTVVDDTSGPDVVETAAEEVAPAAEPAPEKPKPPQLKGKELLKALKDADLLGFYKTPMGSKIPVPARNIKIVQEKGKIRLTGGRHDERFDMTLTPEQANRVLADELVEVGDDEISLNTPTHRRFRHKQESENFRREKGLMRTHVTRRERVGRFGTEQYRLVPIDELPEGTVVPLTIPEQDPAATTGPKIRQDTIARLENILGQITAKQREEAQQYIDQKLPKVLEGYRDVYREAFWKGYQSDNLKGNWNDRGEAERMMGRKEDPIKKGLSKADQAEAEATLKKYANIDGWNEGSNLRSRQRGQREDAVVDPRVLDKDGYIPFQVRRKDGSTANFRLLPTAEAFESFIPRLKRAKAKSYLARRPGVPPTRGLTADEFRAAIEPVLKNWDPLRLPDILVYDTFDAIAKPVRDHILKTVPAEETQNVGGTFIFANDTPTVVLVADVAKTAEDARRLLAHEIVGHFSMDEMLGEAAPKIYADIVKRLGRGDRRLMAVANRFSRVYTNPDGSIDHDILAAETIAHMAERGVRHPTLVKSIAAVRRFMRGLGFKLSFNYDEVEALILKADRRLRVNQRQNKTEQEKRRDEFVDALRDHMPAFQRERPRFFSRLERIIQEKGPESATADQWMVWMTGGRDKGISAAEVRDLRLDGDDLAAYAVNGKVSKAEMVRAVRDAAPEVDIVTLESIDDAARGVDIVYDRDSIVAGGRLQSTGIKVNGVPQALVANIQSVLYTTARPGAGDHSHYEVYVTTRDAPDIVLSRELTASNITEAKNMAILLVNEEIGGHGSWAKWAAYTHPGDKANYREVLIRDNKGPGKFTASDGHWGEIKDIIVHMRVSDRETDYGKTLFIEEIQSDWHQESAKTAAAVREKIRLLRMAERLYDNPRREIEPGEEFPAELFTVTLANLLGETRGTFSRWEDIWTPREADGTFRNPNITTYGHLGVHLNRLYQSRIGNQAVIAEHEKYLAAGAPQAFAGSSNWSRLALKTAIDMAVEEGHNAVMWAGGRSMVRMEGNERAAAGMTRFYEGVLPNTLKKYFKTQGWDIKIEQHAHHIETMDIPVGAAPSPDYWIEGLAFRITDQIKADVKIEGQPRYARRPQAGTGRKKRFQPIDGIFRLPFNVVGGLDEQNRWKYGVAMQKRANKVIRELRPKEGGPFGWLDPVIETGRSNWLNRYGTPEEFIARERQASYDAYEIMTRLNSHLRALKDAEITGDDAKALQEILEGGQITEERLGRLAKPIREDIDFLGKQMVQLGLLPEKTYLKNLGRYLHRSYLEYERQRSKLGKYFSTRRRRGGGLRGDELRARGIHHRVGTVARLLRDIPREQRKAVRDAKHWHVFDRMNEDGTKVGKRVFWPAGWAVPPEYRGAEWVDRGVFELNRFEKGLTLHRDYTKAERQAMGEIRDVRYNMIRTYELLSHDIATGKLYADIAANPEWFRPRNKPPENYKTADDVAKYGLNVVETPWVQVPDFRIPKSSTRRWGALAGGFVQSSIWRDLTEASAMQARGFWADMLREWKKNKTSRSPTVHFNNVMGNVVLTYLHDIPYAALAKALVEFKNNGPMFQEATRYGSFSSGYAIQELQRENMRDVVDQVLREIDPKKPGLLGNSWELIKRLDRRMTRIYQWEDEIFRLASFIHDRENGIPPDMAAKNAIDRFLNYDIRAPWVNFLRRGPRDFPIIAFFPFLSYSYAAVPQMMKAITMRPWKFIALFTMTYVLQEAAYELAEGDEDRERAVMDPRDLGWTWLLLPKMLRMPFLDRDGNPVYLRTTRILPGGGLTDIEQGQIAIPEWLLLSGPIGIAVDVMWNRVAWTGEDIVSEVDTEKDAAIKRLKYLWRSAAPNAPWIPGSWGYFALMKALRGETDIFGRHPDPVLAALRMVGPKLYSYDIEGQKRHRAREYQEKMELFRKELNRAAMRHRRGEISWRTYQQRTRDIKDEMIALAVETARKLQ